MMQCFKYSIWGIGLMQKIQQTSSSYAQKIILIFISYKGRYTMGLIGKMMGLKKDTMGLEKKVPFPLAPLQTFTI